MLGKSHALISIGMLHTSLFPFLECLILKHIEWLRSTGSRIHVYKFAFDIKTETLVLDSELFLHREPGLSSFKDDPKAGAASLQPLLDAALSHVPKAAYATTPINLKATAGLHRLLSNALIMQGCDYCRRKRPMLFSSKCVRFLSHIPFTTTRPTPWRS